MVLGSIPVLFSGPWPGASAEFANWLGSNKRWLEQLGLQSPVTSAKFGNSSEMQVTRVRVLEEAAQSLTLKIQSSPHDPALYNQLGLIYAGLGEMAQAEEAFKKTVQVARAELNGIEQQKDSCQRQAQVNEAAQAELEASRLKIELSAAHSHLACLYERQGQHHKVVAELDALNREGVLGNSVAMREGLTNRPTPPFSHMKPEAAKLLAQAEVLLRANRLREATQLYTSAAVMEPALALPHQQLGLINALNGNRLKAIVEFQEAARLAPGDPQVHNNLGLAYQQASRIAEAKLQFEQALALDPKLLDPAINLGNLYCSIGNYPEAAQVFSQAAFYHPTSSQTLNNLATTYSLMGNYNAAIETFNKTLLLDPEQASAHYGLGLALMQTRQYRQAVSELKEAVRLNPRLVDANEKIDRALRKLTADGGSALGYN